MSNHFRQTAWLALAAPAPLWSIASDVFSMLEGAFGENWKRADLNYTASSHTGINFAAPDLPSLRSQTERFGGPLRDVSIDATLHESGSLYMASANV